MDDINVFFAEQEQRMNLPDEDVDEYIRARLEDLRKTSTIDSDHTINCTVHTQSHNPDDRCKADASWRSSGLFHTSHTESATSKQQISEQELPRQLKRKSSGPELSVQEKKPRLHDTSRGSVPPSAFSRSDNVKCALTPITSTKLRSNIAASPTSQLVAHGKPRDDPFETITSLGRDTDCGQVNDRSLPRQSPNKRPHENELDLPKFSVSTSLSHIAKPAVNHEGDATTAKDLPLAGPISNLSTAQIRKSKVARLASHDATSDQEVTNDNKSKACVTRLEHNEGTSVENKRLSVAQQASPQIDLPEYLAADTSNITSPSNSPDRASGHSNNLASDTDGTESSSRPTTVKLAKVRKTTNSSREKADTSKQSKDKKTKEKPALVTPLEYAQKLQLNFELGKKRKTDYLRGKRILYIGGDMRYASAKTRGRMDYIVKHGGTLVPSYDPATVTHIVTDATTPPTLRALGLKSLKEIPDHIPTVRWTWVISGYGRSGYNKKKRAEELNDTKGKAKAGDDDNDESYLDFEFLHAAFSTRIDAGRSWLKKGKGKQVPAADQAGTSANELSGDFSRISSFTEVDPAEHRRGPTPKLVILPPAPLNFIPTGNEASKPAVHAIDRSSNQARKSPPKTDDPLAGFYDMAKAERDQAGDLGESEPDESDDGEDFSKYPAHVPRRGFTCDRKEPQQRECVNQDIIDKLEELMELHKAKLGEEDRWRVYSYSKCIRALRNYPKKIKSFNEARSINGVGEKTARKIMEIMETGNLRRIGYEKTDDVTAINLFQGIYGVGRQISSMWYNNGCRTLDDIRARKGGIKLSPVQEIGLRFYDDINSRMPRSEAETIFNMIKPIALELDENLYIDIMGSFRRFTLVPLLSRHILNFIDRGKTTCGDIDILITRPTSDGMTHAGLLPELLARLHALKILTEDLALPDDFSALELCYRGLCKLPEPDAKRRRIDILCVPWENRGAALLYYTGDDIFNRAMRMKANVLGYSLNQRGLYAGVVRDPRNRRVKVSAGNIVASETEEEIFKIL
ncbi:hypothetical protein AZE42_07015, partial [Rhizopogon vesiculosus]